MQIKAIVTYDYQWRLSVQVSGIQYIIQHEMRMRCYYQISEETDTYSKAFSRPPRLAAANTSDTLPISNVPSVITANTAQMISKN